MCLPIFNEAFAADIARRQEAISRLRQRDIGIIADQQYNGPIFSRPHPSLKWETVLNHTLDHLGLGPLDNRHDFDNVKFPNIGDEWDFKQAGESMSASQKLHLLVADTLRKMQQSPANSVERRRALQELAYYVSNSAHNALSINDNMIKHLFDHVIEGSITDSDFLEAFAEGDYVDDFNEAARDLPTGAQLYSRFERMYGENGAFKLPFRTEEGIAHDESMLEDDDLPLQRNLVMARDPVSADFDFFDQRFNALRAKHQREVDLDDRGVGTFEDYHRDRLQEYFDQHPRQAILGPLSYLVNIRRRLNIRRHLFSLDFSRSSDV